MHSWTGIGVMSGSSLDGVDLALCRYSLSSTGEWFYEFLASETYPNHSEWSRRLPALPHASAACLAQAHSDYGRYIGGLIQSFQAQHPDPVDFVAVHGHTVFHRPELGYSFQLGDGEVISAFCDCPLINNLRSKDIALGGQGAPLVPVGERLLFRDTKLFLNLGGIVNLSTPSVAFDICIGNQALNDLAAIFDPTLSFDPDGTLAAAGTVDEELMGQLNSLDWFQSPPPKSLGREWYLTEMLPIIDKSASSTRSKLRTLVEHIASQIENGVRDYYGGSGKILVTGGGWYNRCLLGRIRNRLSSLEVTVIESESGELTLFKESLVFGFLGLLNLLGERNVDGGLTGASRSCIGGSLHIPPQRGIRTFKQFDL